MVKVRNSSKSSKKTSKNEEQSWLEEARQEWEQPNTRKLRQIIALLKQAQYIAERKWSEGKEYDAVDNAMKDALTGIDDALNDANRGLPDDPILLEMVLGE